MSSFVQQIKNPYLFKVDNITFKVDFSPSQSFEEVYEKGGVTYMDIYVHADCVGKGNLHTGFSRGM